VTVEGEVVCDLGMSTSIATAINDTEVFGNNIALETVLKPSTSGGILYPARSSASRLAPSERMSLSTSLSAPFASWLPYHLDRRYLPPCAFRRWPSKMGASYL